MTHYRLKGNLEHLRQYGQSAISTKNALRIVNNSFNLPIADMYRIKPDGTVIHAKKVFGHESVTVELPPMIAEPQPAEQRNVIIPPVEWIVDSYYIVYDLIEPGGGSIPTYTGEHLAGYYIPPYLDYSQQARINGAPVYMQVTGLVSLSTDENAALTPTLKRTFQREVESFRNYDYYTREMNTVGYYVIWTAGFDAHGSYIGIASFSHLWTTVQLKLDGVVIKTFNYYTYRNDSIVYGKYPIVVMVGSPGSAVRTGSFGFWAENSFRRAPEDENGDPGAATSDHIQGGAYDPETSAFICLNEENDWSLDWDPTSWYINVGYLNGTRKEVLFFTEYEDYYAFYVHLSEAKIYYLSGQTVFLMCIRWEDEVTEEVIYSYLVFVLDSDGNFQDYRYDVSAGSGAQAFYSHNIPDENGEENTCYGTFRLVKETAVMRGNGEQFTFNPNDETQYDAQRLVVLPGEGY